MGDSQSLLDFFEDVEFGHDGCWGEAALPENLLSILQSLDNAVEAELRPLEEAMFSPRGSSCTTAAAAGIVTPGSTSPGCTLHEGEGKLESSTPRKRMKTAEGAAVAASGEEAAAEGDGQNRMSHITVERNRRKQMNEHLSVLRSLMPCFYVKRGDQASIIGGVVDYIKELQQVLQSLEAKKQRKVYSEVLSPRPVSSPRPSPLSPRPSPLSPRINLPISPRTPQPGSPYKLRMHQPYLSSAVPSSLEPSATLDGASMDLAANSRSPVAEVEVKFSGPNVLLKTISLRIPGQALKIIAALERLALEILNVNINTVDDTMLNSFTIKIGIECDLSAEELANEVQLTFS